MLARMKWIMVQVLRIAAAACYNDLRLHEVHPCQACLGGDALRIAADEMERA